MKLKKAAPKQIRSLEVSWFPLICNMVLDLCMMVVNGFVQFHASADKSGLKEQHQIDAGLLKCYGAY